MKKKDNVKIVRLMGGLGNQFFQYAFAKALQIYSEEKKLEYNIYLDKSSYMRDKQRMDKLKCYSISLEYIGKAKELWLELIYKLTSKLKITATLINQETQLFGEEDLGDIFSDTIRYYLVGFWQNQAYVNSVLSTLRKELCYKMLDDYCNKNQGYANLINQIKATNSVAIHVRRGDYLSDAYSNIYQTQSTDYYKNAIDLVESKIENPVYYVFSDDIEWCKREFSNLEDYDENKFTFVFIDRKVEDNDCLEFELMKNCNNFIIGNSSFSWWAAKLSDCNGIRIAPSRWYYDKELNLKAVNALLKSFIIM